MAIGIDDLDFMEEDYTPSLESAEQQNFGAESDFEKPWLDNTINPQTGIIAEEEPITETDNNEQNIIRDLLKKLGISDPTQIKFLDDSGRIQSKSWDDLTYEEQLNILNTPQDNSNAGLDAAEINLINQLRILGITPEEYQQMLINQGARQYAENNSQQASYMVDDFTDDELYVADLQTRSPELTEEELAQALNYARSNPETFAKQINGIREEYKKLEEEDIRQKELEARAEQQEQIRQFQNNILGQIDNLTAIGDLDIEMTNDDKDELAEFILGRDGAGVSNLGKALNDSETLTKMAWFALHGEETLDDIQEYFADQIQKARQAGYEEGLNAAKKGGKTPEMVIQKPAPRQKTDPKTIYGFLSQTINNINELD